MPFLRREGPLILTSAVAAIAICEYYLQLPAVVSTASFMNRTGVILAAFFIGFGLVNLVRSHTRAITTRRPKWVFSIWLLLVTAITIFTGILPPVTQHPYYQWIYNYLFSTLEPAVFSLIAFFIAAVAFRAFRLQFKIDTFHCNYLEVFINKIMISIIGQAIADKKLLSFRYTSTNKNGRTVETTKVIEPHVLYINTKGNTILQGYQVHGNSASGNSRGIKRFLIEKIRELKITGTTFYPRFGLISKTDKGIPNIIAQI